MPREIDEDVFDDDPCEIPSFKEIQRIIDETLELQEQLLRRLVPTPGQTARYHAVKGLKACLSCKQIRQVTLFSYGETCDWCRGLMDPDRERELRDDRAFVRAFEGAYLRRKGDHQ